MLKALGWIVKLTLFSVAILLAGDWIHWSGKTLAQHVRTQAAHAERSDTASYMRDLTHRVTEDARTGLDKKIKQLKHTTNAVVTDRTEMQAAAPSRTIARTEELIPSSERQKLKALISELNSDHD
jgi:uncharacterized membrane-anchored protein YjiN (DUF445 family)